MNQNPDVIKIIDLLKKGKNYKEGHYHYGYFYLWYEQSKNLFIEKFEDLSINIYEPSIRLTEFNEQDFSEHLIKNYKLQDVIRVLENSD